MKTHPVILIWDGDDGEQFVRFDVTDTYSHESIVTATDLPIEDGSVISDHIQEQPDRFVLEGIVSNTPLFTNPGGPTQYTNIDLDVATPPSQVFNPVAAIGSLLSKPTGSPSASIADYSTRDEEDRLSAIDTVLREAQAAKTLFRIESRYGTIENVVLERISRTQSGSADYNKAAFSLALKKIKLIQTETVATVPVPSELRAVGAAALGNKQSNDTAGDEERNGNARSLAAKIADGAGGILGNLF